MECVRICLLVIIIFFGIIRKSADHTPSQTLNSYTGCQVCKVSAVPAPLTFQVVLSLSSSARNYFLSVSFPSSSVNTSSSPPLLLWLILFSLTTVPLQFFSTAHPWIGTRLSLLSSPFLSRPVPPSLLDHPLSSLALDIFLSCSGSFHPILFFCLVFSPAWSLPLIFLNSALLLRAKYFWVNYSQRSRTTRPQDNNKDILFNTLLSAYYHEGCQVQTMKKKRDDTLRFPLYVLLSRNASHKEPLTAAFSNCMHSLQWV